VNEQESTPATSAFVDVDDNIQHNCPCPMTGWRFGLMARKPTAGSIPRE
jgi:hypothetical protein